MAFRVYNFENNDDVKIVAQTGQFKVIQWNRDLSVSPDSAQTAYFCAEMDVRRRQLVADLDGSIGVTLQAGAMQWTVGSVRATTGVKGVGDLVGKMFKGAVSQDSAIKPEYTGVGKLVCEPTWNHILLLDTSQWGNSVVLNDGLFLACDSTLRHELQRRSNLSSAAAGNEGLFNLRIDGCGTIERIEADDNAVWYTVGAAPELMRYIVQKGSVTLDGISLTVADVERSRFKVSVIPHTRAVTNLGSKAPGSPVNIETDIIGKYVEKLLSPTQPASEGISLEQLAALGF